MRHKHVVHVPQTSTPSNHFGLIMFAIFQNKTVLSFSQSAAFVDSDYVLTSLYPIHTVLHTWKLQNKLGKGPGKKKWPYNEPWTEIKRFPLMVLELRRLWAIMCLHAHDYAYKRINNSSPQNQKNRLFLLAAPLLFIHLHRFGVSCWVLEISAIEMSALSTI